MKKKFILILILMMFAVIFTPEGGAQHDSVAAKPSEIKHIILEVSNGNYVDVLDVDAVNIRDLLQAMSQESNFDIVIDDDIQGKISILLTDIEIRDALRIILDRLHLAFSEEVMDINSEERNIIRIMSLKEFESMFGYSFKDESSTQVVPLVYSQSEDITGVLEELKTPEGKIIFNQETNTYILMDNPKALKAMMDVIKKLDVPIETREIVLNTPITDSIVEKVRERLTKEVGSLEVDKDTNKFIITDTLLKIQELERVIDDLDFAKQGVQLDVKVIQITLNDEHKTGVDWAAIVSNYKNLKFTAFDTKRALRKEREFLSFGTITAEDLKILTEALETVGDIKTVFVDQFEVEGDKEIGFVIPVEAISSVENETQTKEFPLAEDDVKFYIYSTIAEENIIKTDILP